ncbi:MAG: RepB family plasmid replication initiator protein, partial [Candidatus Electrothrix sp. ATG2]|nr:RepB family plasmid replication initiator protein [Candidatus Electrothrix sp. ATG2]
MKGGQINNKRGGGLSNMSPYGTLIKIIQKKTRKHMPMTKKSPLVVQSNKLIESRYSLTVGEQRLILAMVARIHPDDEDFFKYEITLRELAELMNVDLPYAYHEIDRITERLMERVLHIPQADGDLLKVHWVSTALHRKNSVVLSFAPELKPYLLRL